MRSIVCLANGYEFEASSLAVAVALAKAAGAHLRIIHAAYLARPSASYFGYASTFATGLVEAIDTQIKRDLARAREGAETICAQNGLSLDAPNAQTLPRAEFLPLIDYTEGALLQEFRLSDLIVIGGQSGSPGVIQSTTPNLALFGTGRPVLLVRPKDEPQVIDGGVCGLAWNDSAEAMHTLVHGRDVLARAKRVHVIVAGGGEGEDPSPATQRALGYLAAHGVDVAYHGVARTGVSAASAVLAEAHRLSCDYLAMGAYGHSMFREVLIGGFSEDMLSEAQLPLLLCH